MSVSVTRAIRALAIILALLALAGCGQTPGASGPAATPTATVPATATLTAKPATATPLGASPTPQGVPTVDPTAIKLPDPAHVTPIPGWLHTDGTRIVDANGRTVLLATVNWYGAEGQTFVPGGLDKLPYMDILLTIKALGFNSVRLPFSDELVERNPRVYEHLAANRALIGKHALEILDAIVDGARQTGLMIILDNHRSDAGWTAQENGLWYTDRYPETAWIADWVTLARRYKNNPAVVGYDLRNEPHSHGPGEYILGLGYLRQGATWGPYQGVSNPRSDWRLAAERAGNAILAVNPHALIIVEGTQIYPNSNGTPDVYWWGGNLRGAMAYPVQLNVPHRLVYSVHEYGPQMHSQTWITPTMTEADWDRIFDQHWGDLLARSGPDAAPIWIGEFGTPHSTPIDIVSPPPGSQSQWLQALLRYVKAHNIGWSYWAINADSFGLLTPDWRHLARPALMQQLRSIEPAA